MRSEHGWSTQVPSWCWQCIATLRWCGLTPAESPDLTGQHWMDLGRWLLVHNSQFRQLLWQQFWIFWANDSCKDEETNWCGWVRTNLAWLGKYGLQVHAWQSSFLPKRRKGIGSKAANGMAMLHTPIAGLNELQVRARLRMTRRDMPSTAAHDVACMT